MQTGKINVHTENIFPIIKKFLYSDHEIFLRELVSNAVDASQKLRTLAASGEFQGELGELRVEVLVDKEAKTLTIRDRGIGMTADEIERYINQIAFSGAEEFVEKYKDRPEANAIIGHFGLGFYSAFMVASKVEIQTRSWKDDAEAAHWECDGSPEFQLGAGTRTERGTDIILHIADDATEFLETERIRSLLNKYCKFLPVEIQFDGATINNTNPAWTRKPVDLKDEDYAAFYEELYPFAEKPLFHIHLNVDYPFNLTGILYFPKMQRNFEVQKNKIQLYCNQVYVTDSVEGIVPEFLTLLHGVIDSPDIPLNVSRSYLQSDGNVKKISGHITRKVADKLDEMFRNQREEYEQKWNDVKLFIQYGMLSDDKFQEKAERFNLFQNVEGKFFNAEELREALKLNQTDKNEQLVVLYATARDEQHAYIQAARDRGYEVLLMDSALDPHLLNLLESKWEKTRFVRVDADTPDKLIVKDEPTVSKLSEEQQQQLKELMETKGKPGFTVQLEAMSETDMPVMVTRPEFMRRMKDMSALGGGNPFMRDMPDSLNLVVNSNHPLATRILEEHDERRKEAMILQATDLALLAQGLLKGEELTRFLQRSAQQIA